jgi:hypothetical protein
MVAHYFAYRGIMAGRAAAMGFPSSFCPPLGPHGFDPLQTEERDKKKIRQKG